MKNQKSFFLILLLTGILIIMVTIVGFSPFSLSENISPQILGKKTFLPGKRKGLLRPTSSLTPTLTPTSTPAFTPTPTPIPANCIMPTNYPPPPVGGMTYANWYFYKQDINSITNRFKIYNDPGLTSHLYLQLYDGRIDGIGYYFGVQTTHLVLFSRWETTDLANVRTGPNAYKITSTSEGSFVGLRLKYDISATTYTTHLQRAEFDGVGDWYDLYITKEGETGLGTYVGGVRFPRSNPLIPASLWDGGGTWTEFWDNNNNTTLYPVPLWHVGIYPPLANNQWSPVEVRTHYSAMPNSDAYFDKTENIVQMTIGDETPRCHPAALLPL